MTIYAHKHVGVTIYHIQWKNYLQAITRTDHIYEIHDLKKQKKKDIWRTYLIMEITTKPKDLKGEENSVEVRNRQRQRAEIAEMRYVEEKSAELNRR